MIYSIMVRMFMLFAMPIFVGYCIYRLGMGSVILGVLLYILILTSPLILWMSIKYLYIFMRDMFYFVDNINRTFHGDI